ncbi:protease inhibitor I42 family protein [Nonomuraea turcica]|uniref:protease inhibitor I42 family protein n=1 Tax=Nonomuraea sp. G32 TaxID=3067274 RepID=UPI00273A9EC2|nr:protease inhibitor I42 family protein [Nonomuraea sp. G32]MDP4508274.1 protease inhibitor I42 family protein [Nonomuraea sp. G32]
MRLRAATWLAVLAVAGCGGGTAVSDYGMVVKGAKGTTVHVEVRPGQRFSLAVADNPSVGDDWSLVAVPDTKVASFISEEHEGEGGGPGSGGTTYFVFNPKRPGTTEIRLFNCWRCGQDRTPATEESRRQSGEAIFAVTVK